jgi:hypothetical protein
MRCKGRHGHTAPSQHLLQHLTQQIARRLTEEFGIVHRLVLLSQAHPLNQVYRRFRRCRRAKVCTMRELVPENK